MVKRYSISEAQDRLPGLVHEVEGGARVELTREGKPVAMILSVPESASGLEPGAESERDFWAAYEEFRRTHDLTQEEDDLLDVFEEVRDRSTGRDFSW